MERTSIQTRTWNRRLTFRWYSSCRSQKSSPIHRRWCELLLANIDIWWSTWCYHSVPSSFVIHASWLSQRSGPTTVTGNVLRTDRQPRVPVSRCWAGVWCSRTWNGSEPWRSERPFHEYSRRPVHSWPDRFQSPNRCRSSRFWGAIYLPAFVVSLHISVRAATTCGNCTPNCCGWARRGSRTAGDGQRIFVPSVWTSRLSCPLRLRGRQLD